MINLTFQSMHSFAWDGLIYVQIIIYVQYLIYVQICTQMTISTQMIKPGCTQTRYCTQIRFIKNFGCKQGFVLEQLRSDTQLVVFLVLVKKPSSSFRVYSAILTKLRPLFRYTGQIYRGISRSKTITVFSPLHVRFFVKTKITRKQLK